jgi:two-component system chemotaxis sensor kinase CheA
MDVVRKNIQALGGRIGIQSELGKGRASRSACR